MEQKLGKVLTPDDINAILTGPARVYKPNGQLLCVVLRNVIPQDMRDHAWRILSPIKEKHENRGMAGGGGRVRSSERNTYANPVASNILGHIEGSGARFPACRTTAWTGRNAEQFDSLMPYFGVVAAAFAEYVPDRYKVQKARADATKPEWVIGDTPFSTITVNNTYATGVHKDAGDLQEGFSCLTVMREGAYSGGVLCFPEFRVGVDLGDKDVILMDAHEWHGNTQIVAEPGQYHERVSVVLYYRTDILHCGTGKEEFEKAKRKALVSRP